MPALFDPARLSRKQKKQTVLPEKIIFFVLIFEHFCAEHLFAQNYAKISTHFFKSQPEILAKF